MVYKNITSHHINEEIPNKCHYGSKPVTVLPFARAFSNTSLFPPLKWGVILQPQLNISRSTEQNPKIIEQFFHSYLFRGCFALRIELVQVFLVISISALFSFIGILVILLKLRILTFYLLYSFN